MKYVVAWALQSLLRKSEVFFFFFAKKSFKKNMTDWNND